MDKINFFLNKNFTIGKYIAIVCFVATIITIIGCTVCFFTYNFNKFEIPKFTTVKQEFEQQLHGINTSETSTKNAKKTIPTKYWGDVAKIIESTKLDPKVKDNIDEFWEVIPEGKEKLYLQGLKDYITECIQYAEKEPQVMDVYLSNGIRADYGDGYRAYEVYLGNKDKLKNSEGVYNLYISKAVVIDYNLQFIKSDEKFSETILKNNEKLTGILNILRIASIIFVSIFVILLLIRIEENTRQKSS